MTQPEVSRARAVKALNDAEELDFIFTCVFHVEVPHFIMMSDYQGRVICFYLIFVCVHVFQLQMLDAKHKLFS